MSNLSQLEIQNMREILECRMSYLEIQNIRKIEKNLNVESRASQNVKKIKENLNVECRMSNLEIQIKISGKSKKI